eukprot:scaffold6743_cov158-Ochromonas_danica.AAC.13
MGIVPCPPRGCDMWQRGWTPRRQCGHLPGRGWSSWTGPAAAGWAGSGPCRRRGSSPRCSGTCADCAPRQALTPY